MFESVTGGNVIGREGVIAERIGVALLALRRLCWRKCAESIVAAEAECKGASHLLGKQQAEIESASATRTSAPASEELVWSEPGGVAFDQRGEGRPPVNDCNSIKLRLAFEPHCNLPRNLILRAVDYASA